MINELTFNGKSFSEFSAYIATSNFLDGAAKDIQSVSIVGRSGALQLSNDKYNNLTLKVRMYITNDMQENMRKMRNFLESCWGYCRYEETQTPNEFRMASFKAAFVPDVYDVNVGVVDLTFDSMPQRFLKAGENWTTVSSSSSEISGNPVSISNPSGLTALTGLNVDIQPVQDLNGYDHPWAGGAGKNLLNYDAWKTVEINHGTAVWENNGVTLTATATDCYTRYNDSTFPVNARVPVTQGETVTLSWESDATAAKNGVCYIFPNGGITGKVNATATAGTISYTVGSGVTYVSFRIGVGNNGDTIHYKNIMIRKSGNATFEPYSNICPITGHTSATVQRTVDGSATDYTIDLNGTIYGGTLDVLTGVLTVDRAMIVLNGASPNTVTDFISTNQFVRATYNKSNAVFNAGEPANGNKKVLSDKFESTSWEAEKGNAYINIYGSLQICVPVTTLSKEAVSAWFEENPTQIVYELATPTTIQLTPQQVSLLTGTNIISTDMNSLTVTLSNPAELENPTLFESKPLIRVYGNGTLNVNDQYITVANSPYTYVDIDCELMDCYHGSNNANQYVSFSTTDYLTLRSGTNYFSYSGFTKVEVTPRWFEV